ncbi:MAG TPA: hypothetical protein DHW10_02300 [Rhodospirillaceae bacterium]|nr:hypothetical protein [Rhodospirillaceae bacterium]|tara:strand:+ start:2722 stop:3102 length:381 start_codon:yes stop_codon:yes gene_type:complete
MQAEPAKDAFSRKAPMKIQYLNNLAEFEAAMYNDTAKLVSVDVDIYGENPAARFKADMLSDTYLMVTKANVEAWALQVEKGSKAEKLLTQAINTFKSHENSFAHSSTGRAFEETRRRTFASRALTG